MSVEMNTLFKQHGGVMTTAELKAAGYYYKKIKTLIESNKIEQVRRGYYQIVDDDIFSNIPSIVRMFPDGIICMESALDYYGYTDRTPSAWNIAVDYRTARTRFNVDYPIIKPHFIRTNRFKVGITEGLIDNRTVKIYDRERTICDMLLHRNKVDGEVFNTAIQRYVKDPRKNEANLIKYAKLLHVERKVREVIGIWL